MATPSPDVAALLDEARSGLALLATNPDRLVTDQVRILARVVDRLVRAIEATS